MFSYSSYERQNPRSQCIHNSARPVALSNKSPAPGTVCVSAIVMQWVVHKPNDVLPACTCQQASGIIWQHIPEKKIIHYYGSVDSYIIQTFKEQCHLLLH